MASLALVLVGTGRAGLLFRLVWPHFIFTSGLVLGVVVEILKAEMHFAIKVKLLCRLYFFFYALFFYLFFFLLGYGFFCLLLRSFGFSFFLFALGSIKHET